MDGTGLIVLGSGSRGNSILVFEDDSALLIDAGLSYKETMERMPREFDVDTLEGVLASHSHGDHTQCLRSLIEKNGLRIWATADTKAPRQTAPATDEHPAVRQKKITEVLDMYPAAWVNVPLRSVFKVGPWSVIAYPVHHQSAGAVTFIVRSPSQRSKIAMFIETGEVTAEMFAEAKRAWAYIIEANHDKMMLANDEKRPERVNDRAADGHLSNEQARELIWNEDGLYIGPEAQAVVFTHVSADCNYPPAELETMMREANAKRPVPMREVHVSRHDKPTPVIRYKGE